MLSKESFTSGVYRKKIPFLHLNDFHGVKLHQDKAANDTYRNTIVFLEKNEDCYNYLVDNFLTCSCTAPDSSSMNYCEFDRLKRALSKSKPTMINGVLKVVDE